MPKAQQKQVTKAKVVTAGDVPPGQYDVKFVGQTTTMWECEIINGEHKGKRFWLSKGSKATEMQYATHTTHLTVQ